MSDEELKKDQGAEKIIDALSEEENEELNTEWLGEDEWDEEEEEEEEVAGEEVPTFIDNGDGTISDTRNNLMWAKTDSYAEFKYGINWFEAQDYCESLNEKEFAGYDDWRLMQYRGGKNDVFFYYE